MTPWRIYYAADLVRDHTAGPPPGLSDMRTHYEVQVILQYRQDGRPHLIHGHDAYVLDISGYWLPIDRDSIMYRFMFYRESTLAVCAGFCIPLPAYQATYDKAKADKDQWETLDKHSPSL